MGKAKEIGAYVRLKDNYTPVLRGIKKENKIFKQEAIAVRKAIEKTIGKAIKVKIESTQAYKKAMQLRKSIEPLRRKIVVATAIKDMISRKVNTMSNKVKVLGRTIATPVIKVKDMASKTIGAIGSKLKTLGKGVVAVGAGAAVAGIAGATKAIGSGIELEKQMVSMEHFIGVNNKGKSQEEIKKVSGTYLDDLRNNANATPFTASEVISAGTRALGVVGGDTKQAMDLVKVAEDMAALTPGKTIQDAMEALADAKNGEMERLKEFNAKVSADEFNQLGFQGVVNQKLKSQFEGGASKLSTTGGGLWSTITGKIGSSVQDIGLQMLEKLKPTLESIIKFIDGPAFTRVGDTISSVINTVADGMGSLVNTIRENMPKIKEFISPLVEQYMPAIKESFYTVKDIVGQAWGVITQVLQDSKPLIEPVFNFLVSSCKLFWETVEFIVPKIISAFQWLWDKVKPIIDPLANAIGWIGDKIGGAAEWVGGIGNKIGNTLGKPSKKEKTQFIDGSHATGLKSVPFDGYIAELHKGEAVVPSSQNPYTTGSKGVGETPLNINIYKSDTNEIIKEVVVELKTVLSNM